jgi:hypothetical protein
MRILSLATPSLFPTCPEYFDAGQVAELKGARCTEIFQEKVSGAKTDRKQLARVIDRLDEGDILVVTAR